MISNIEEAVLTEPRAETRPGSNLRICLVDSLPSQGRSVLPTQGALLAEYLSREGALVIKTSEVAGKISRAVDMAATLVRQASEFDVVLIQLFGYRAFNYGRLTSWIARKLHKRVVLVLRDGSLPAEWQRRPERIREVLDRADAIVAPSAYMASVFQGAGYDVKVIPNFIEIERYVFRLRRRLEPRLFWVRSFHHHYNPQMAVEVFALLKKDFPNAVLSMGGPDRGELHDCRQQVERLGVADSVRFLGFLTKAQLAAEASRHDIYLHTNRIDNTPVTILENMALGLPIVATRVGGVPYLVRDGETALLVDSENAQAMSATVTRLLTEPELAARLSKSGRAFVEGTCTWSAIREKWSRTLCR